MGFTGSLNAGRALFDLCAARPNPIPFFGELGSTNPVFLLPEALAARGAEIAAAWAGSLTMGAGQFCTNPGVVVALDGPEAVGFAKAAAAALSGVGAQTMLTEGIAQAYQRGRNAVANVTGVTPLMTSDPVVRAAAPDLFQVGASDWLADERLGHEVFGPMGVMVLAADLAEMQAVATRLVGQLTATLQMDDGDTEIARTLLPVLERKAGRILVNGFPTGVEVADAMVHGGPYPASTNFGHSSVGTIAIRRWLRPVCYQNLPAALLPDDVINAG